MSRQETGGKEHGAALVLNTVLLWCSYSIFRYVFPKQPLKRIAHDTQQ